MTDPSGPASPSDNPRTDQAFPRLNEEQLARVGAHGHVREVQRGARLVEAGAQDAPLFVVMTGSIEIVQSRNGVDTPVAEHGPGEFTGEVTMLSGRPSFVTARASVPDWWSSSIAFCHAAHSAHPWPGRNRGQRLATCGIARALVCKDREILTEARQSEVRRPTENARVRRQAPLASALQFPHVRTHVPSDG